MKSMKQHIKQFFNFLEKKENRKVPLRAKLLNPKDYEIGPEDLNVKGDVYLGNTSVTLLPDNLTVGGDLELLRTPMKELPDSLKVGGSLYLSHNPIQSLPDNLTVNGFLVLTNIAIDSIPNNLKVGKGLYAKGVRVNGSPLAQKYTEEEIRSAIEKKGGFLKGDIVLKY
jgi:hypothetical protein